MKIFKLPDLGEGLPDAIIREWYIKAGDVVKKDQPLVSMETAKALVDVPAPFDATIEKLFGEANDTIQTGQPLIGFEGAADASDIKKDTGTIVGKIEQSEKMISGNSISNYAVFTAQNIKATPAVRALARKLNVDLSRIQLSGAQITTNDVEKAAQQKTQLAASNNIDTSNWEVLSNTKRAMVMSMQQSHHDIVPVTLIDEVDIHAWVGKQDITVRIVRAMIAACKKEPALNAHFDSKTMRIKKYDDMNLGLAVDMPHGLYVPIIKNVANLSDDAIRSAVEKFKSQAQTKSIAQSDLHGATIVLSNFGAIAGRFANPIILPPTVAIVGVGRMTKQVFVNHNNQPELHRVIPLSISVDHRAITGGEVARFLRAMMDTLALPDNE